jgi:hypothetical protein
VPSTDNTAPAVNLTQSLSNGATSLSTVMSVYVIDTSDMITGDQIAAYKPDPASTDDFVPSANKLA